MVGLAEIDLLIQARYKTSRLVLIHANGILHSIPQAVVFDHIIDFSDLLA